MGWVYDSHKYARYYETYGANPVFDLELVVSECLRRRIFGDQMGTYQHADADLFARHQAAGQLPSNLYEDAT